MNVTDKDLLTYIETFHRTLESVAQDYLPQNQRSKLLHSALLPAKIKGYISTQFGVAIEYERASETTIQIIKGSARVEDLLLQAPTRYRDAAPLISTAAVNAVLNNVSFSGSFPFRLTSVSASISIGDSIFRIDSWFRIIQFAEIHGNRDLENWSEGKAESRAKDEVLAAMLQLRRAQERKISISEYVHEFKNKSVLVLGDYEADGIGRLLAISKVLTEHGYEPILVKDIPDHPHHDITQKVVAIGAICRFVLVDDSSKSGHLLEVQLCKQNSWVTVLLRAGGVGGSWMTAGASHASNVIFELPYDPSSPQQAINIAVKWAEEKLHEIQRKFESTYPWRAKS